MNVALNNMKDIYMIQLDACLDMPHHVYLKDFDGKYLECNDIQAKSFGLSRGDDVLGKTDKDFISESEYSQVFLNDQQILTHDKPRIFIEAATFQQRTTQPTLSYKIPLRNSSGKIIGVMGTSVILTDDFLNPPTLNNSHNFHPNHKNPDENLLNKVNKISARERECLNLLACGMTAKHIGRKLNLSSRTVEFYIENMKRKFNCANRIELIAKVYPLIQN